MFSDLPWERDVGAGMSLSENAAELKSHRPL